MELCYHYHNRPNQRQRFQIPLSTQRYCWVRDFLVSEPSITSVTDFGCGTGRIIYWLKHAENLTLVNFVDSDTLLLDRCLTDFQPPLGESLLGREHSKKDLWVKVFNTDVRIPNPNLKADLITMVELIEHMHLADVRMATRTIFGYYQPRFVIVTTPNIEFNYLLREPGESPDAFRHDDHKFEWNREQFLQYVRQVCAEYPYDITLGGVGEMPGKSEACGPATQIALFRRRTPQSPELERTVEMECCDIMMSNLGVNDREHQGLSPFSALGKDYRVQYKYPGRRYEPSPMVQYGSW